MTRDQIRERMARFYRSLAQEQELRDELCALKFTNVSEEVAKQSLSRQHQLLDRIKRLHNDEMLPLVNELADFVSAKLKDAPKKTSAAPAKKGRQPLPPSNR